MAGLGQLARTYATYLMIWNAWGLLYATFGSLITALQFNRIDQVMNQGFLRGFFQGTSDTTVLGMVSIFYALALGLIPFIAKRLISGDVGSTAYSVVRAGAAALGVAVSGATGFAAGASAASEAGATSTVSAGSGASAATATSAAASSSAPPPQPSLAETIRAGVMSAVTAGAPPAPSTSDTGTESQAAAATAGSGGSSGTASSTRKPQSPTAFRPIGVSQTVAFHAGKFAGSVIRANGRNGTDERGNA
jgi:hypothetical protein